MSSYLLESVQKEAYELISEGSDSLSDTHLLALAQSLAIKFYAAHGNVVSPDFNFAKSKHGQEHLMWHMALQAVGDLRNCDMFSILEDYDND